MPDLWNEDQQPTLKYGDIREPIHMTEIINGLWLGSQDAAEDKESLDLCNIFHIITLREPQHKEEVEGKDQKDRTYQRIWIQDKASADLSLHWLSILTTLKSCLENKPKKPVLVHCRAGISRSASVVAAFLIHRYNLKSADEAIELICRKRIVSPNEGFHRQLDTFVALRPDMIHFYLRKHKPLSSVTGKSRRVRRLRRFPFVF
jgi:protein-tyrosine phosphatase